MNKADDRSNENLIRIQQLKVDCQNCYGWGEVYITIMNIKRKTYKLIGCEDCSGTGLHPIPLTEIR